MKLTSEVIHGDKIGRTVGYPTANIDIDFFECTLVSGVYVSHILLKGGQYNGLLVVQKEMQKAEVHLLDYLGEDFYSQVIEIDVFDKISEIERFTDVPSLKKKIQHDIDKARKWLEKNSSE
ncbi:MAG: hypothetical protein COV59_02475 [Candidatus Magasanikbacteria bacterium CG11_big_fil_rev_8_21_14_0_20_39_34]|uniref:riboflavin kinase n=1 Tax=Candidatus Magasanikbacteria bacterium CG11_big_fil_rev_8_21_14_0_20_39_34 TaxID=1974653 RepID=A0A2H0N554_9BACT|nr:MAG: hypothetical protein COV59_02475 [Candidatus Magasanikbacteria bacterium CG11_big_fil_rev_8_21_14_0_20_39_34]